MIVVYRRGFMVAVFGYIASVGFRSTMSYDVYRKVIFFNFTERYNRVLTITIEDKLLTPAGKGSTSLPVP
jgi:hypothetical protein